MVVGEGKKKKNGMVSVQDSAVLNNVSCPVGEEW